MEKKLNICINCEMEDALNFKFNYDCLFNLNKILFYLKKILQKKCKKSLIKLILFSNNISDDEKKIIKELFFSKKVSQLRIGKDYKDILSLRPILQNIIKSKNNIFRSFYNFIKKVNSQIFKNILKQKAIKELAINKSIYEKLNTENLNKILKEKQIKKYKKIINQIKFKEKKMVFWKGIKVNIYIGKSFFDFNIPSDFRNEKQYRQIQLRIKKYNLFIENRKINTSDLYNEFSKYKKFFLFLFNLKFNEKLKEINYKNLNEIKIDNSLITKTLNKLLITKSLMFIFNFMNVSCYDLYLFFKKLTNISNETNNIFTFAALDLAYNSETYMPFLAKNNINFYDFFEIVSEKINFNNKNFIKSIFFNILKTKNSGNVIKYINENKILSDSKIFKKLLNIFK